MSTEENHVIAIEETIRGLENIQENITDLLKDVSNPEDMRNKILERAKNDLDNYDIYQTLLIAISNVATNHTGFKDNVTKLMNKKISKMLFTLYTLKDSENTLIGVKKRQITMINDLKEIKEIKDIIKNEQNTVNIPGIGAVKLSGIVSIALIPLITLVLIFGAYKIDPTATKDIITAVRGISVAKDDK